MLTPGGIERKAIGYRSETFLQVQNVAWSDSQGTQPVPEAASQPHEANQLAPNAVCLGRAVTSQGRYGEPTLLRRGLEHPAPIVKQKQRKAEPVLGAAYRFWPKRASILFENQLAKMCQGPNGYPVVAMAWLTGKMSVLAPGLFSLCLTRCLAVGAGISVAVDVDPLEALGAPPPV